MRLSRQNHWADVISVLLLLHWGQERETAQKELMKIIMKKNVSLRKTSSTVYGSLHDKVRRRCQSSRHCLVSVLKPWDDVSAASLVMNCQSGKESIGTKSVVFSLSGVQKTRSYFIKVFVTFWCTLEKSSVLLGNLTPVFYHKMLLTN